RRAEAEVVGREQVVLGAQVAVAEVVDDLPGMGGGAGAGGNEKDRQRTTWLAEDEEVWGTESGAVEGVIGR
ncbi:hypothetical protein ACWC5I_30550, partial [Kitasatospora sp. NPDC001574]